MVLFWGFMGALIRYQLNSKRRVSKINRESETAGGRGGEKEIKKWVKFKRNIKIK